MAEINAALKAVSAKAAREFTMNGEGEKDLERIIASACNEYAAMVLQSIHRIDPPAATGIKPKSVV